MQSVKIQTGFSEKATANFNSQQFTVSLEMECHINGTTTEIETAAAKLFDLCKKIVAAQKQKTEPETPARQELPSAIKQPQTPGGNRDLAATSKQISAIYAISRAAGLNKAQLEEFVGKPISTSTLSKVGAGNLIEDLLALETKRKVAA